ncbi:MAG TPA: YihY/virulence factor BrkB family protein, partial [Lactobacillus sp.]|nr:YihY/virulence factor BrkB family protein [Lactobacillus sp.]
MQTGFKGFVKLLIRRFSNANVNDSAAVLSYYMLLSIFPILLIAGNLIAFLHFNTNSVLRYVEPVLPEPVFQTLAPIIRSFLEQGSTGTLSLGIVVTIWSAGRAVSAFQRSINLAYGIEQPNAIISRFFSFILILLAIISIVIIAILFSLSEWLGSYLKPWFNLSNHFTDFVGSLRWPISFLFIFLLSGLLYMVVPSAKVKLRYVWIGAFVTTVGWLLLAQGFSIYIRYFARNITGYQTIGTFIILLIWMNISGFILLAGGVINASVQEWRQGE